MRDRIFGAAALLAILTPIVWALAAWWWRTNAQPGRIYIYPPPESPPLIPPAVFVVSVSVALLCASAVLRRRLQHRR